MKTFFALAIIAAAANAMANQDSSAPIFETKEAALKAAGLDIYETPRNIDVIQNVGKNIEEIPSSIYSGTWIEYDENNNAYQVIAVNSPSGFNKKSTELNHIKTILVKYSTSDLENIRKKVWGLFDWQNYEDEPLVLGIAIDDENNRIIVRAREENLHEVQNLISEKINFDDAISYEKQDGPVVFHGNIYGGTKIASYLPNSPNTQYGSVCTAGFNVLIDGLYQGTLTSGHCLHQAGNPSWTSVYFNNSTTGTSASKGAYIGEYLADEFPNGIDAILFGNVSHVHTTSSQFYGSGSTLQKTKGVGTPVLNSNICTYGGVNKWRCGVQKIINSQQIYNGVYYTFSEATFCGAGGDSGGPVVNGSNYALGLYAGVVGGNQDPKGTCGASVGGTTKPNSIYQSLAPYLAKYPGVKLQLN